MCCKPPGVTVAIPSAVSRAELDENLGALTLPALSDVEMRDMLQAGLSAA
jgi:aryl-alcohol dehydrogenase-like predicted oxidoreductase